MCGGGDWQGAGKTGQASFSQVCSTREARRNQPPHPPHPPPLLPGLERKADSQGAKTQEKARPWEGSLADRRQLINVLGGDPVSPQTPLPLPWIHADRLWLGWGGGGGRPGTAGVICFQHNHQRDREGAPWAQLQLLEKASSQFQLSWRSRTAEAGSPARDAVCL